MDKFSKNSQALSSDAQRARERLLEGLQSAIAEKRLGHALLLVADDTQSAEFQSFLKVLFSTLLCLNLKATGPCATCASCKLLAAPFSEQVHPDALCLTPENSKGYSVDQIRALLESFSLTRSLSPARLCWISSAELLSAGGAAPANALLKLLEEPRPESFLILSSSRGDAILPTIKSRCQVFKVPLDAPLEALENDWALLKDWLLSGASARNLPSLPPDSDDFWSERDEALAELEKVYLQLWAQTRGSLGTLERDEIQRILDFFRIFEALIRAVRGFAAAPLQWSWLRQQSALLEQGYRPEIS